MAFEPSLILLDEVMAGLNQTEIAGSIDMFRRLQPGGLTFLIIEHNLKVVRALSQRVMVLDQGCRSREGNAEQMLTDARSGGCLSREAARR